MKNTWNLAHLSQLRMMEKRNTNDAKRKHFYQLRECSFLGMLRNTAQKEVKRGVEEIYSPSLSYESWNKRTCVFTQRCVTSQAKSTKQQTIFCYRKDSTCFFRTYKIKTFAGQVRAENNNRITTANQQQKLAILLNYNIFKW